MLAADGARVPAKPTGLEVSTTAGSLDVSVDWDDVAGTVDYYWVQWRLHGEVQSLTDGVRPTSSSETITVAGHGRWVVRVRACNSAGCSAPAAESFDTEPAPSPTTTTTTTTTTTLPPTTTTTTPPTTTPVVPAKPTGLKVTTTSGWLGALVDWDDVDGADDYRVQWRLHGPDQALNDGLQPTSSTETITVDGHGKYVVRVQACNDAGCSGPVAESFTVSPLPPGPPANVVLAATLSGFEVTASWDAKQGATSYSLTWQSLEGTGLTGGSKDVSGTSTTVELAGSGDRQFNLQACNDGGCGATLVKTVDVANVADEQKTTVELVDNTGQTSTTVVNLSSRQAVAQGFTTGPSSDGYRLTSIEMSMKDAAGDDSTKLVTGVTTGTTSPETDFVDLTEPGTWTDNALNTLTPPANTTLLPNTTYWVYMENALSSEVKTTASNNEDSGMAWGWSIADNRHEQEGNNLTWSTNSSPMLIRVNGYAIDETPPTVGRATINSARTKLTITLSDQDLNTTAPAASSFTYKAGGTDQGDPSTVTISGNVVTLTWTSAVSTTGTLTLDYAQPTANPLQDAAGNKVASFTDQEVNIEVTLIQNLNKNVGTATGTNIVTNDAAQAFTTGSNALGYKLTSIVLGMLVGSGAAEPTDYSVKICNDSSGAPGTTCSDLDEPASLSGGGADVFAASSAGIDLDQNTTYWVVFYTTSGGSGTVEVRRTDNDGEDSGGATGWSIDDDGQSRTATSTGSWTQGSHPHKIGIFGYAKTDTTPPTVSSATIDAAGTTLTVQLSEGVKGVLNVVDWPYTVDGVNRGSPSGITGTLAQGRISLTLSPAVTQGQVVRLSYSKGPFNVLRDDANNHLANLTNRAVTNNSQVGATQTPTQTPSTPTTQQPESDDGRVVFPGPWISPSVHRADVSGRTVIVTMDKKVAVGSGNLKDAFTVRVKGTVYNPTAAQVADYGYQVRLTMPGEFSASGCPKMSVEYAGGVLVDPDDDERREVHSFGLYESGQCVAPKPNSKWISGRNVYVNMDKSVTLNTDTYRTADDVDLRESFTVYINRRGYTPVGVYVDGRNIRLDMGERLSPIVKRWGPQPWPANVTKLSIDYEPPAGMSNKPLYDAATGEPLLGFGIY